MHASKSTTRIVAIASCSFVIAAVSSPSWAHPGHGAGRRLERTSLLD